MMQQAQENTSSHESSEVSVDVPLNTSSSHGQKSFGTNAAQISWQLPIVMVVVNIVISGTIQESNWLWSIFIAVLIAIGFSAGVIALVSIAKYGWRRILIPAIFGILFNGALIYLTVYAMLRAIELRDGR
jgi:hypothetical protein